MNNYIATAILCSVSIATVSASEKAFDRELKYEQQQVVKPLSQAERRRNFTIGKIEFDDATQFFHNSHVHRSSLSWMPSMQHLRELRIERWTKLRYKQLEQFSSDIESGKYNTQELASRHEGLYEDLIHARLYVACQIMKAKEMRSGMKETIEKLDRLRDKVTWGFFGEGNDDPQAFFTYTHAILNLRSTSCK